MDKNIHIDVPGQSEDALQQKCYFWFWNTYPNFRGLLFSVPNGGTRDPREVKKFNLTGLVSGVSDLILLHRTHCYLIELKKDNKKSKQSKNQLEWQKQVEGQGFIYFIIRSLADFKLTIKNIVE